MWHASARSTVAAVCLTGLVSVCGGSDGDGEAESRDRAPACAVERLASLELESAQILAAEPVAAGRYTPAGSTAALDRLPAFCRVTGRAMPSSDSLVDFELWVPQREAWNGKLVTTGNGGYSPAPSWRDMAYALRQGYATIGGDTGHQGDPNAMDWGVGHPEKIRDWGTRSIHAITGPGKRIVAALQGSAARRAYYYGCSTGGHQGYAEVQDYPDDFDGVIAGAPGNNRIALNAEFLWRFRANRVEGDDAALMLTPPKAALITRTAVAACDTLDGVEDGVIADPRACDATRFEVGSLRCDGAERADCLTEAQIGAARAIYAGPRNPRTGASIYPGPVVGTEASWPGYWGGAAPVRVDFWRLWAYEDPAWDWWSFDFDRDYARAEAKLGRLVDHVDADVEAFAARGGKLITYHGWADAVVSALDTVRYHERVVAAQGSEDKVNGFFRLFMVPGMGHCGGGTGPTVFGNAGTAPPVIDAGHDLLSALDRWVEAGVAPDRIVATELVDGTVVATRSLCPWPQQAAYLGHGPVSDAASYACRRVDGRATGKPGGE